LTELKGVIGPWRCMHSTECHSSCKWKSTRRDANTACWL